MMRSADPISTTPTVSIRPGCGLLRCCCGKREVKRRRLVWHALNPHSAAMRLDEPLGNVEPEPHASYARFARARESLESSEDPACLVRCDTFAAVGDGNVQFRVGAGHMYLDFTICLSVLRGIADQVSENLRETHRVGEHSSRRIVLGDLHRAVDRQVRYPRDRVVDNAAWLDQGPFEGELI